jgi:hypothetical protein
MGLTWCFAEVSGCIGTERGASRDGTGLSTYLAATRTYAYRSRIRCRDYRRRMGGLAYGRGPRQHVYYQCPHNPPNPRRRPATRTTPHGQGPRDPPG